MFIPYEKHTFAERDIHSQDKHIISNDLPTTSALSTGSRLCIVGCDLWGQSGSGRRGREVVLVTGRDVVERTSGPGAAGQWVAVTARLTTMVNGDLLLTGLVTSHMRAVRTGGMLTCPCLTLSFLTLRFPAFTPQLLRFD